MFCTSLGRHNKYLNIDVLRNEGAGPPEGVRLPGKERLADQCSTPLNRSSLGPCTSHTLQYNPFAFTPDRIAAESLSHTAHLAKTHKKRDTTHIETERMAQAYMHECMFECMHKHMNEHMRARIRAHHTHMPLVQNQKTQHIHTTRRLHVNENWTTKACGIC
jgi:hypothetical protein